MIQGLFSATIHPGSICPLHTHKFPLQGITNQVRTHLTVRPGSRPGTMGARACPGLESRYFIWVLFFNSEWPTLSGITSVHFFIENISTEGNSNTRVNIHARRVSYGRLRAQGAAPSSVTHLHGRNMSDINNTEVSHSCEEQQQSNPP